MRKFAQVFHVGAIIELIENDDLMNEEEENVKFNKLSVLFHPKKERKRERETHIIAVKNLIDPVCLKTTQRRRPRSVAVHRKKL